MKHRASEAVEGRCYIDLAVAMSQREASRSISGQKGNR